MPKDSGLTQKIEVHSGKISVAQLREGLKDKWWRLNNLYWIKNEAGERVPYILNWAQQILFKFIWFLNVVLKARQFGVTTFFCISYLDDVLFLGLDAGLIAHTLQDAVKIFDTKVKFPWENLLPVIKKTFKVDTDTTRELKFKLKGSQVESSIYVGTSLRSGTVQRLHVSELGTIDEKYPQKAKEIMTGALNTVHEGGIVTIESTAKGETGKFYDTCMLAMEHKKSGKDLTTMDYAFFFFPWYMHPGYQLEGDIVIPAEMVEYFESIEIKQKIKLSQAYRNWYYKKSLTQGDDMKREFPSTAEEAFEVSVEGAYYGKQMDRALEEKRITSVPWEALIPVDTWWDLGIAKKRSDAMSIVFTQTIKMEIHVIDFLGGSGEGIGYYIKELDKKPYNYGSHYAPHDIMVKELTTGKTRYETAQKLGITFLLVPKIGFLEGVQAVRNIFNKLWFDEAKTDHLRKALRNYRKEWDEIKGKFKDNPIDDWTRDPADAIRYMAVGHPEHQRMGAYDKEEEELRRVQEYQEGRVPSPGGWDPFDPFKL